jgi:Tfp pilus assembly protein PilF
MINGLGIAYSENKNYNLAIKTYQKGIEIDPKIPNFYHNIANVYLQEQKIDLAKKYYQKALEVNPNFFYSKEILNQLP